jgi:flagellar biosynthesis component FlhA
LLIVKLQLAALLPSTVVAVIVTIPGLTVATSFSMFPTFMLVVCLFKATPVTALPEITLTLQVVV